MLDGQSSYGHVQQWSHVKAKEGWEIGREMNPIHKIFWVDVAFFLGLGLMATWQTWDYAMAKARNGNKGYLFSGAHHLWRIAGTCFLAAILVICELIWPGRTAMHVVGALVMFLDAAMLYIHTEKTPMPLIFPGVEAIFTILLAFSVTDKGRLTCPMILMIASFRFAAEFWPLKADEDSFKIVSATLMMTLSWHWFPLTEAINVWNVEKAEEQPNNAMYTNWVDLIFWFDLIAGHLTVLFVLWKILPQFFSNELAYERQDGADGAELGNKVGTWS